MRTFLATLCLLLSTAPAFAIEPGEIVILVNRKSNASRMLADHYIAKRGVPKENVVELTLTTDEDIPRDHFNRLVLTPLRDALEARKDKVKCLLSTYGIPLRVGGQEPTAAEKKQVEELKTSLEVAKKALANLENEKANASDILAAKAEINRIEGTIATLSYKESLAAFDSELMLLWHTGYKLTRWQSNALHWQFPVEKRAKLPTTLMVSRLDGPTFDIAKRLIDDAVAVEETGLVGKVYFDARGIGFDAKKPGDSFGYGGYDESYREAAELLKAAKFDVTLDNKNEVFAADTCPDAALYSGWYSHGNYVPSCKFAKGAVAWHLASSEAVTLRNDKSKVWCPNLLKAGVAATLGPVAEPYTIGFPKPAEFFGFLATGKYTLAECYAKTVYFTSWMTVLVGDPLYNPYKKTPKLDEAKLAPSPKGGQSMFK